MIIDVRTAAILDLEPGIAALQVRAMQIAAALPAWRPNAQVAAEYLAPDAMRAENLPPEEAV